MQSRLESSSFCDKAKRNGVRVSVPSNITQDKQLVLLIGWLGSSEKLLRHYVNVYTDLGYPVLSHIPSGSQFVSQSLRSSNVKRVLSVLMDDELNLVSSNETSLFIHVISNNGGMFYAEMMTLTTSDAKYKGLLGKICGMCAEALPGVQKDDVRICSVLSGLDHTAAGGKSRKSSIGNWLNPVSWFVYLMQLIIWLYFYVIVMLGFGSGSFLAYMDRMKNPAAKWPVLALYTEGDFVVPAEQVAAYWKSVPQEVELHEIKGKDINHIQGLVKAPQEYKKTIAKFIGNL